MSRLRLPEFIHEVIDDPRQRGVLLAASLALFAVGLTPRVLSPGLPTAQEALRDDPEMQNVFLLLSFVATATIIVGGLASDIIRRREVLIGALITMAAGSAVSLVFDDGVIFIAANFVAVAAAGAVLAFGIGSVAAAYEGIPRATALGFVYGAFGAGAAASPAVLTLFPRLLESDDPSVPSSFTFDTFLAYVLTLLATAVALWAASRWIPDLPGKLPATRWFIVAIGIWSLGVLAVATGALGLFGPANELLPFGLIVAGVLALLTLRIRFDRTIDAVAGLRLDRRGLGAALAVGVAVGFAQAVPLMLLPVVFEYPLNYGTLLAIFAIAPFAIALFLAGPISGILIRRFGPRGIMTGGTAALGVANILLALTLVWISGSVRDAFAANSEGSDPGLAEFHYLLFVLPLVLVGAGFVVSTTVRTAIVFASTPRGLPASAAAINEASVGLGSRVGIVAATTALTAAAVGSARGMVSDRPAAEATALVDEFEKTLVSLGTPRFEQVFDATLAGAEPIKLAAYGVAYMDGVTAALIISGVAGIVGALLAWFMIGRRDPISTVFDMQDERDDHGARSPEPAAERDSTSRAWLDGHVSRMALPPDTPAAARQSRGPDVIVAGADGSRSA